MADWIEIQVTVQSDEQAQAAADTLQLFAVGDEGVALEQLGDPNDVSPTAMLPETRVKLYVDAARADDNLRQAITIALSKQNLPAPTLSPLNDVDWENAWKVHYTPIRIGEHFWIRPEWETVHAAPDDIVLTLDPGMAFGTGTHETSQLCLELLETIVQPNQSLLDLGCGSGILAIGAAKLGARPILAVDIDDIAVRSTQTNSITNEVAQLIEIRQGSTESAEGTTWDIVVANILAPILIEMLSQGHLMPLVKAHGNLILSGILAVQEDEMRQAIQKAGGYVQNVVTKNDWIAMHVVTSI